MTTKKSYPFEQSLVKLENLVEKMEAGDLTLYSPHPRMPAGVEPGRTESENADRGKRSAGEP
jgi:hypothetical protein